MSEESKEKQERAPDGAVPRRTAQPGVCICGHYTSLHSRKIRYCGDTGCKGCGCPFFRQEDEISIGLQDGSLRMRFPGDEQGAALPTEAPSSTESSEYLRGRERGIAEAARQAQDCLDQGVFVTLIPEAIRALSGNADPQATPPSPPVVQENQQWAGQSHAPRVVTCDCAVLTGGHVVHVPTCWKATDRCTFCEGHGWLYEQPANVKATCPMCKGSGRFASEQPPAGPPSAAAALPEAK